MHARRAALVRTGCVATLGRITLCTGNTPFVKAAGALGVPLF